MSHNFSEVFKQLVPHGKATLVMKTDPVEQAVWATYMLLLLNLLIGYKLVGIFYEKITNDQNPDIYYWCDASLVTERTFAIVDVPGVQLLSLFDPYVSQGSKAYASVTG